MNTFMNTLQNVTNFGYTENGAVKRLSTNSAVYDMFAFGGAYRSRSDADVTLLFKNAYEEDPTLALKCLFYLADCRGGQGERRFFRVAFRWLCMMHPTKATNLLKQIPEYRRWDDLIYTCVGTPVQSEALAIVKHQLALDVECKAPSLLAKWLPSENASSTQTKAMGNIVRKSLGMSHKQYRKTLSVLRTRINVLEKLMSEGRWEEIEFDKIPSKAGLIYKNAFARRDLIAKKYEVFAKDTTTKVNASTLYPYDVVKKAREAFCDRYGYGYGRRGASDTDRAMINKYWENLPDYLKGADCRLMCVVDTSGSMTSCYGTSVAPIDVAISLGLYTAERVGGPFANHYISFASRPQLIKTEGVDFVDKVDRIYRTNLVDNTNLTAAFDLLYDVATRPGVKAEDVPNTLVVISDMEIDSGAAGGWGRNCNFPSWGRDNAATEMEKVRAKWQAAGLECPRLVYWNCCARANTILDNGPGVSFVSGCSPVIFEQILTGKSGFSLMLDKLMSDRYAAIG